MAELEQDADYQARRKARDAEIEAAAEERRAAREPVMADLRAAGVEVSDTYDLYKHPEHYPAAIPVLLTHLERDYPDRVLEDIGHGLPFKPDPSWWDDFKALYLKTTSDAVRGRLAAAMGGCARRAHYEDLLSFVRDEHLGQSRIHFLRPINRIGNRIRAGQGRAVIEDLASDSVLGREAGAILKGRSRSQ
ncbi:hypothetical protein GCM10009623_32710 [Nocardioides aestuarii]